MSKYLLSGALAIFGALSYGGYAARKDPLDGVDIDTEYQLIQMKKSGLSASQRRRVESIYKNRHNNGETK